MDCRAFAIRGCEKMKINQQFIVYTIRPEDFAPTVEVAAVYVNVRGKILLLQIAHHKSEGGKWGVPAGKIEVGETPLKGAQRELFEETGIVIDSEERFRSFGSLYIRKPHIDYVYHLFQVTLDEIIPIHLSAEHMSYVWATWREAEQLPLMIAGKEALDFYFHSTSAE